MRLPKFEYKDPKDLGEALELLHTHGNDGRILAGGTDLLVRMQQRLAQPKILISLKHLQDLAYIRQEDGCLKIGALTTLGDICASDLVKDLLPGFWQAVRSIGAATIQHTRGTIGGNLCQDNRCAFHNQSAFFRSTQQPCHKAGGQICYAVEGSDRCRSTCQSDGAPALIALSTQVTIKGRDETRSIPLAEFYTTKGEDPLALAADEMLTELKIPIPRAQVGSAYQKLSYRSAIDYPILSVAVAVETENSKIQAARIVIGAIAGAPLYLMQASASLQGKATTDQSAIEAAVAMAGDHAAVFAVDNVHSNLEYRINMIAVLVRRALENALQQTENR